MAPESYQASITSGTRVDVSPHCGHGNVTSSICGRCGSIPETSRPASSPSSRQGADRLGVSGRAPPDRERRSPVAFARDRPIDVVLQPVPVPAALDVLGVPLHGVVDLEQAILHGGRPHVPGGARDVQQRGVAPPAERIRVLVRLGSQQQAATTEVVHDRGIGVLHEDPADERRGQIGEPARVVDRLEHRPSLLAPDRQVVGARTPGPCGRRRSPRPSTPSRPATTVWAPSTFGYGGSYGHRAARRRERQLGRPSVAQHAIRESLRQDQPLAAALRPPGRADRMRRPRRCSTGGSTASSSTPASDAPSSSG